MAQPTSAVRHIATQKDGDWITQCSAELDVYFEALKHLNQLDPVEIFQSLSAFSARATELRVRLARVETKRATTFRTREVEPLLEEIDRQFRVHSRLLTFRELEWKASGERGLT
jgi:hypothetical protein